MSSPIIHLEEYYLNKVHIERKELGDFNGDASLVLSFSYDVKRRPDSSRHFLLSFRAYTDSSVKIVNPLLYDLEFNIVGFFAFDEGIEEEKMQYLIRVNGCTILYGIMRGMFGAMTGAFPEGPIPLPTIMMDDVVKAVEEKRQKASSKPKAKKASKKTISKIVKKVARKKK